MAQTEAQKAAKRRWRVNNPEAYREQVRRRNKARYARKKAKREEGKPDACQVCGGPPPIMYDHCHRSGVHRGWLCNTCNITLGASQDDPERLRALAAYLECAPRVEPNLSREPGPPKERRVSGRLFRNGK